MNQIKRYGFSVLFLAASVLLSSQAYANEATISGEVSNVNTEEQTFQLNATPTTSVTPGTAEVNVTPETGYVGAAGLAGLKNGDEVEVESTGSVSGEVKAETVTIV